MHSCSLGAVMLTLDTCQHSYLKNSKSAPVSQYQLWMSLHKCACLPAGKTQKIPELPTQHISIQKRKLNRSHLTVLEKLLWKTRQKSTQTFQCQGNRATCFALGKRHNDTQIGTCPTGGNQRPKGLWTTAVTVLNTNPNGGYLLLQGTCYSISVFLTVDRTWEHSFYLWGQQRLTSDLPCISSSARLRRGQVSKQVKNTFQNGQFYIKLCSFFFSDWVFFNIKFVSVILILAF